MLFFLKANIIKFIQDCSAKKKTLFRNSSLNSDAFFGTEIKYSLNGSQMTLGINVVGE